MGELFAYDFISNQEMRRIELNDKEMQKSLLREGDLIFARRSLVLEGSGKCSIVMQTPEPMTFESSIIRARLDRSKADPLFYFYFFKSPRGRVAMASIASRTAVSGIRGSELMQLSVDNPPLDFQSKVASILHDYDLLIHNNLRRIGILEEIARTIFTKWFVKFQFPGHEKMSISESLGQKIPQGWELRPIGEVVETLGGGTPSTKRPDYWDHGEITWFTPSDLTEFGSMFIEESSKKITETGLDNCSAKLFPAYSIMMTSRATIGVVSINTNIACTNQGFITCIPNERISVYQLYFWLEQNMERIVSVASGATYKEINRSEFREIPILIADKPTRANFVSVVEPLGKLIETLLKKNTRLRKIRDLLLLKLASSQLSVSDLESKREDDRT
jgi:type I restriction enzyme S subunit